MSAFETHQSHFLLDTGMIDYERFRRLQYAVGQDV